MLAISPRYTLTKLSNGKLEDKIDVYEDQILGWVVAPAKLMFPYQHSGFAILALALTYFEPLGQSLAGQFEGSYTCFRQGLLTVYPNVHVPNEQVLRQLYDQLRCGMFHRGLTKNLVQINQSQDAAIVMHGDRGVVQSLIVNPWALLENVEQHVIEHCAALRIPNDSRRQAFEKWFNQRGA